MTDPTRVLERAWKYRTRRRRVVNWRLNEVDVRLYEAAELSVWALTHPHYMDDVILAIDHFTDDDEREVLERIDRLRRLSHVAIEAAATGALDRWRQHHRARWHA